MGDRSQANGKTGCEQQLFQRFLYHAQIPFRYCCCFAGEHSPAMDRIVIGAAVKRRQWCVKLGKETIFSAAKQGFAGM